MVKRLEAQMIEPIKNIMEDEMELGVVAKEFSAGYGRADLVGAHFSDEGCFSRQEIGFKDVTLSNYRLVETFMALEPGVNTTYDKLLGKVGISVSTLQKNILPKLENLGLIEHKKGKSAQLLFTFPTPVDFIVAIEAKQTRWREAILQARRYTFFADYTYIAVWNGTARLVNEDMLSKHSLGLIAVEDDIAEILVPAPRKKPRVSEMNRYCAEFLYHLWTQGNI